MEKSQDDEQIGPYRVVNKIGEGSFGQIFDVDHQGTRYAVKTETISNVKPMLTLEYELFKKLQASNTQGFKGHGFPRVYDFKEEELFSYMAMEKLDTTLQDLVNLQLKNKIDKDVLIVIMYNTFKCIQSLHEIGYLYRDVKPSNFMIKRSQLEEKEAKIYLIDLGLCKKYLKSNSNEHIPLKGNKKMIGTAVFCSMNTHRGLECGRRDDLESWVYMVIYLVCKLPWEAFAAQSVPSNMEDSELDRKQSIYEKMGRLKGETNIQQLIRENSSLPLCLVTIYERIKGLEFDERPNYELIEQLLQQEYDKLTGRRTLLKEVHFRVNTHITKTESSPQKKIKINFKLPQKKLKKVLTLPTDKKENILQKGNEHSV